MPVIHKLNIPYTTPKVMCAVKEYFLHTKTGRINIDDFKIQNCEIPQDALEYSYIRVGKESDNLFMKEIIAFFDNAGNIIQQVFRTNGETLAKRQYTYPKEHVRIIDFFSSNGKKTATELQKTRYVDDAKQLLTKRINYLQDENNNSVREIIFTHFPRIGKQKTHQKLVAGAKIVTENGQEVITDFYKSGFCTTFDVSKDDKYLLFRLLGLNTSEGLVALTQRFLKEKLISPLNLRIRPSAANLDSYTEGAFSVMSREISYNPILRDKMPLRIVSTAAHEVEHAYQYSQIGRLGKGRSAYETDALRILGDLKFEEIPEAIKYSDARYNYPVNIKGNELNKNEKYLTNYLEVKAREAGEKAQEDYMHSNVHNYLFFDLSYS